MFWGKKLKTLRVCEKFGILLLSPRARSTSLRVNCVEGSIKIDSSTPLPLRLRLGLKAISARNDETGFSHTLLKSLPIKYFCLSSFRFAMDFDDSGCSRRNVSRGTSKKK